MSLLSEDRRSQKQTEQVTTQETLDLVVSQVYESLTNTLLTYSGRTPWNRSGRYIGEARGHPNHGFSGTEVSRCDHPLSLFLLFGVLRLFLPYTVYRLS